VPEGSRRASSMLTPAQEAQVDREHAARWATILRTHTRPTIKGLAAKLAKIERINPDDLVAFDLFIDHYIKGATEAMHAERGMNRTIQARLLRKHDCDSKEGGKFFQVEPLYGVPRWECQGCAETVTLED